MIDAIIKFCLERRLLVIVGAVILTVYGLRTAADLPIDVFPDLNRPIVTVMTEAHGLAPEEVEARITLPLESALNGAPGVYRVRSASAVGFSMLWTEFDWDTNIYLARQIVTEKIAQAAAAFPAEARPALSPISSIMGEILLVGLTSAGATPLELRTITEQRIRPRLLSVGGVSQVAVIGGELKQYHVLVDPQKMRRFNLSLHEVEEALRGSNATTSGGFLIGAVQESLVRVLAPVRSIEDLESAVISRPAASAGAPPLRLRDVARVVEAGPAARRGDAAINTRPGVILSIQKQPQADTLELTAAIERELEALRPALPADAEVHYVFRQDTFIRRSIDNVILALRDGAILVAIVLFLFLLSARTTFITLTAIPLSILVSAIVFHLFGLSINTMTLGGLAIAIGEVVDDAIVDVENVLRRLRENAALPAPRPALEVVFAASSEVRNSIVFATLIVILVFLPLFALGGIEGRIFSPLGVAYITSILASLVVSLTVTPALCSVLLPRSVRAVHHRDSRFLQTLKSAHTAVLSKLIGRPWPILIVTTGLALVAAVLFARFGREFLPPFNEGAVVVEAVLPPGSSLAESNRIGAIAERALLTIPELRTTGRRTGRAELDEHAQGVYHSEIEATLEPSARTQAEIFRDIRMKLSEIPGLASSIGQPLSHRIDHILSGVRSQIAVKIFGPDLITLRRLAGEVNAAAATVPGLVDRFVERLVLIPQIHIRVNRERAAQYGLMAGEAAEYVETALNGRTVTRVLEGQQSIEVVLRLADEAREGVEAIRDLPIDTHHGQLIPLGLVADVEEARGPNAIAREDASRRIIVSANVADRDLVSAVTELRQTIAATVQLPPGYFIEYGGQFEVQASASRLILLLSLLSLLGIFVLLLTHFRSLNLACQVMLAIPLALIGAAFGLALTGGTFSIASLVGLITLVGIATRNGIMLIDHYLHLLEHEGEKFGLPMIFRGTAERLTPVLMTALTASLALVPILVAPYEPGREIIFPVAVVIFSGLGTSTVLNLLLTPIVFYRWAPAAIRSRYA